jgi:hypothetical protein|tara:strand:- start:635 stop:1126 length:492 start_codon:yes stop_codon:yes gene_type:complete
MNTLKFNTITDFQINKYLDYRNLDINLQNSVFNKKIKKLDHYIWWLSNIDRKSYIVKRGNTDLIVLYHSINFFKKKKFIFPGYFICGNKFSVSELLSSIKWQNATLDKINGDKICAIIVPKNNLFSNAHSKYFKYKILDEKNKLYKQLKEIKSFNKKFNIYTR